MDFRGDNRAQALQVGAILLFGFLILGLSLYQATVVPDQNRGVEFNAYQDAAAGLAELRNDVITAASKDTTTGTNVRTGAVYPSRSVFINPPPPNGELRTTDPRNVTLENVTAVDGEPANAERFVEAALDGRNYSTRDVRFTPDYNVFNGQPMVVTGQQAYRYTSGEDARFLPTTGQTLLQGDRLNLLFVDGDLSAQGATTTVTTEPVSASTQTVTITGNGSSNITLRLGTPPGITAETWVNRTGEQLNASNPRVLDVEPDGDRIRIVLDGSETYKLKMAKVEVREENDVSVVGDTTAEYVVTDTAATQTIQQGSRTELTVEVRDEFNNPVAGEEVTFTAARGEFVLSNDTKTNTTTARTNSEGKATVVYSATNGGSDISAGSDTVDASIGGGPDYVTATFDIGVTAADDTGLNLNELSIQSGTATNRNKDTGKTATNESVEFQVRNTEGQNMTIVGFALNRTTTNAQFITSGDDSKSPYQTELYIETGDSSRDGSYNGSGSAYTIGTTIGSTDAGWENAIITQGETATVYLTSFSTAKDPKKPKDVDMEGEYLEVTFIYETEGGERVTKTATVFLF